MADLKGARETTSYNGLVIMAAEKSGTEESAKKKPRIKVSRNGPYLVEGGVPLIKQKAIANAEGIPYRWQTIERYPLQQRYALCRCGESKNQPFCDGTHIKIGFDGEETASREPCLNLSERIGGLSLNLTDARELCASARFCHLSGGIRKLIQSNDPEARGKAIEIAANCPAGRLVVWDKNTGEAIEPIFEPSIVLVEDTQAGVSGPLWVRGGIPIESTDGLTYEIRNRVTLCRCGRSGNKPFCDGNHLE